MTDKLFPARVEELGVPRWLGPKRIYAVQNQTLAITSSPRAATGAITVDSLAGIEDGDTLTFTPTVGDPEIWKFRDVLGLGPIATAVVNDAGLLYEVNDVLGVDGGTGGQITVDTVGVGGAIATYHVSTPGTVYGPGPITAAATSGSATGSGATFDLTVTADPLEILRSVVDEADQATKMYDSLNGPSGLVMGDGNGPGSGSLATFFSLQTGAAGNNNPVISTTASGLSLTQFTGGNDGGDFTVLYGFSFGKIVFGGGTSEGETFSIVPTEGAPEVWTYRDFPSLPFEIQASGDVVETVAAINAESSIARALEQPSSTFVVIQLTEGTAAFVIEADMASPPDIFQPSDGAIGAGESDPINFNDNAAAVQAAIEAIPALTGHATVTGDMPTSNIALDSTITVPLLFVLGANNLVDGAGAGAVDIYIKDADILTTLVTPTDGDTVGQVIIKTIEQFTAGAATVEADSISRALTASPLTSAPPAQSNGLAADFPFVSAGGPVVLNITGAGGGGNTAGSADVWYEIATPGPSA